MNQLKISGLAQKISYSISRELAHKKRQLLSAANSLSFTTFSSLEFQVGYERKKTSKKSQVFEVVHSNYECFVSPECYKFNSSRKKETHDLTACTEKGCRAHDVRKQHQTKCFSQHCKNKYFAPYFSHSNCV